SEPREISNTRYAEVLSPLESSHAKPNGLANVEPEILEFKTAYLVNYNIHQDFVTSVRRVHSIHANKHSLLVNAVDGRMIDSDTAGFMLASWGREGIHPGYDSLKVTREEFKLDSQSVLEKAKTHII